MPPKTNDFAASLPAFHRALSRWYKAHGRHELPWRITRDPYAIYVSEIMLQQTQVATVRERYYGPFLERFPTIAALAAAPAREVMKSWEGLGYYRRAAHLHEAAKRSKGKLPALVETLMALPGIGRNTAHAVAAFAYGTPVPVMEANVKRVLCRIFALKTPDERALWEKAELLLNRKHPFDYNQAMMDIGAMVCTKRAPRCDICPAATICKGKISPESYPAAKAKKQVPVRGRIIAVFTDGAGQYFLAPRATRFLGGLYGFVEADADALSVTFMGRIYPLAGAKLLGAVSQSYSHFTLDARVVLLKMKGQMRKAAGMIKANLAEMKRLPLSRADQKVADLLASAEAFRAA